MEQEKLLTTENFYTMPLYRQVGLFVGLAVSIAIAVSIILWAQQEDYEVLYSSLDSKDAADVADGLAELDIPYDIQSKTGAILVPAEHVDKAKIKLAAKGLPNSASRGFEMLEKKQAFGSSQFMELTRYRHALEGELAQTVASMNAVRTARVHLAIPKDPVFVRDRRKASASVFVDLYSGRSLSRMQVQAIVNMVASSVPDMQVANVTVVDQKGNLLSANGEQDDVAVTAKQLEIKQRIERDYAQRIRQILVPILGAERIKAQVAAELDFTIEESTSERYDPEVEVVRSLQEVRQGGGGTATVSGSPGRLESRTQNMPPLPRSQNDGVLRTTRNYELDKTISHTKRQPWRLHRLSVAVAIDDQKMRNPDGNRVSVKVPAEQLIQFKELIKNAVGFDVNRGDTIEVVNIPFAPAKRLPMLPEKAFWEESWFSKLVKYVVSGIVVLIFVFGVIKPMIKRLTVLPPLEQEAIAFTDDMGDGDLSSNTHVTGATGAATMDNSDIAQQVLNAQLPEMSSTYSNRAESVRNMVRDDPARVAGVVLDWVGEEDE